jgi:hypothetical protein
MSGMLTAGANRLLSDDYERASFLPVVRHKQTGKRSLGVPQVAKDVLSALMLPGDVYQGNVPAYGADGRTSPQMIEGAANLGGMITVGAGAIPAEANSLRMGIKAYHGSPHDFDRFDMSKIGTGEGAQAYGHGLYFAEAEDVAKAYRDNLSKNKNIDGAMQAAWDKAAKLADALKDPSLAVGSPEFKSAQSAYMKAVYEANSIAPSNPGRMYEVNIDANPDDFLDWDKPLSEQGPRVQQALNPLLDEYVRPSDFKVDFERGPIPVADRHGGHTKPDKFMVSLKDPNGQVGYVGFGDNRDDAMKDALAGIMPTTGARAYERLARGFDKSPAQMWGIGSGATSQALKEQGIPGIKYLDAGSRGAGDGSRNYVVFDDKLISIVKKYGVAALVSAGVLSQAQGEEMKAQGYY